MGSTWDEADVAIIGMAGRFPGADDVGELWRNLRDGVSSVRELADDELLASGVDPAHLGQPNLVKVIAMPRGIDRFDATFFGFSHREAEVMDPQQRLLLECSWEALEDAGYVGETYPGPTGVFAGVSTSTYLLYQVMANPAVLATLDPLHLDLGNSGDYLTTRISHKLNLTGPSYLVQCACSTGLVAVHAACQSLLAEECDMALAGSGSINVGQLRGYLYQEGGIVSPDGRCRTFDARAQGSIVGSGLGMVVLKRLADAVADGDSIRAVIKGSAINNDGGLKVGYTAPSVEGQARVVAEALARSGVEAADISYVEAHGSGTALGDPIEVEALTRAFNSNGRRQFCALGSVKTNVGHLATAAGITGLIKTVLALEHGMIPPSLHFERPNPQIDFADSPFYVNVELRPWPQNGAPRRAGVSAFGFGGTNAHVIVEEAPAPLPSTISPRPCQLLLLSAKSSTALAAATANLASYLRANPELDLADVAYTLQRGRKHFGHRRALACRNREEAIGLLAEPISEGVFTGCAEPAPQGVAFLFPGLGDQHLHMAAGLYASEPTFRAEVDRSCELLAPSLGLDLREVLYPERVSGQDGRNAAPGRDLRQLLWRGAETTGEAARRLDRTLFAHPATFVVEHALARLWIDWGVGPKAMIGYSLGEYTAACIAGVLGLEEALCLVAERARLIEELPAGAMLAIPLSELEVRPLLGPDLSLAAINAPQMCVVAGTGSAVTEIEGELARRGIASRLLRTSHAFHSRLMEPVAQRLVERMGRLTLKPPRIPYLSNVTGTWITSREATDPQYWGRHLCEPVRFSAGLGEIFEEPGRFLLEVGPGQALSTFARQHPAAGGATVVPCLGEGGGAADEATLLRAAGRLWLAGVEVDGARFFRHERRRRVALPTYPFERQRYWIEASPAATLARPSAARDQTAGPASTGSPEVVVVPSAGLSEHPRPALRNAYVAPRDTAEQKIAGIWQKLLGVDEIGIHDDFFELGGHSFLTTVLVTELRRTFGVDVGIRELFEKPTVAGFAAAITAEPLPEEEVATPAASPPQVLPDPGSRHLPFPLTDVQQAYLIGRGDVFALGQVSTHAYAEVDGRGIDLARLTRAFRYLIDRHDMLRAVVHADGRQEILASVASYEIAVLDLRGSSEEAVAAALGAIRRKMSHQVLPSDRWPLFELRATLLDGDRVRLHLSFDFLIGDAWSLQVLLPELSLAYHGRETELPPLSLSFRDYVVATAAVEEWPAYRRAASYWTARLDGFPLAPELPLAVNPESVRRPAFVRHSGRLETAAWQRLKERAARGGLTPSGLLLAAFAEVLTVWSKSPRFAINLTLFNRLPLHPEVNHLVGDFTSLTLLAIDNSRPGPFGERAQRIQKQLFEDLDHSAFSGIRVLRELARRQGGHVPAMMPVVFTSTLTQISPREALAGLGEAELGFVISQTPQVWLDHQVLEDPLGLSYSWDVVEELFPAGLIADMLESYQALLARLAGEEPLWQDPRPVLPPERQLALFAAANATEGPLPDGLLHAPFAAQATSCPERVAVLAGDLALTYGELARRANALARRLRALGATPGSLVAVVMEKGWEQVAGVLAVLTSGAAYLPIDPELPRARRFYLFANGGVALALTQPHLAQELEWPPEVRWLAVSGARPAAGDGRPLPAIQGPRDLAYVIYTSGSTGEPKGVMIDHQGALNTVVDIDERFGVGPEDHVLALSALSFDLSVYDLFGLLAAGGTVVLPEAGQWRDPQHWAQLVDRHGVTVWNTVPALMEMLADFGEVTGYRAPSLRLVLLSGDWISLRLPERIGELAPAAAVLSLGGATEASIWSILFPVDEVASEWRSVPYGRPMRNQRFHVLDADLAPRPVGVPGHLYIGGVGLAQGYWRDPVKTSRSFVAEPRTGGRLYRTGDLGRYLPDGTIEFLGREDFQVKVGGFRIELGEIEAALTRHPAVHEALVLAAAGAPGSRRLVAYLVPAAGCSLGPVELRTFLGEQLPAYMVPADFVTLEAFPLTANGKVDRQALPCAQSDDAPAEIPYAVPRGPVEELLAGFFGEVLKLDRVGAADDFFELGGNSLLAAQVTSRLRAGFGVDLPLRTLFEKPTLGELARAIERQMSAGDGAAVALPPLLPRPPGSAATDLPLSFSQQRLWFLDRFQPGSPLYNIPLAVRVTGALSVGTVQSCLGEIERRHEALRSVFVSGEGATPVQLVRPPALAHLPLVDLSDCDPWAAEEPLALGPGGLVSEEVRRPFDLARGPLWRGLLLRFGREDHLLLLSVHHIVSDGWSQGILMGELQALYQAFSAGLPSPLPELPVQYADFAVWQRGWLQGELLDRQLAYWKRQLAGAPPVLELPTDRPRPAVQTSAGAALAFALADDLTRDLEALSRRSGVTLFMTLLAAFQALLGRYSGQDDVVVGTPVAGRNHLLTEGLIGFFVNNLAIRIRLDGAADFLALLARVREGTLLAFAHQDLPFEKLVGELQMERDLSHAPVFQVVFALQNAPFPPRGIPGLELAPVTVETGTAKFDLAVALEPVGGSLWGDLEYSRDLFDEATMRRLARHFAVLLAGAAAAPGRPLPELPLLSEPERTQLFREWNDSARACPQVPLVHELFAAHARLRPHAVGVGSPLGRLTYGELERRSNRLAHHLRGLGVGPEVLVAICTERTFERVVGIVGVLKAGGAYVSLDPGYPPERLAFLIEDARAPVLLTEQSFAGGLPECAAEVLRLDADWPAIEGDEDLPPASGVGPENLSYVVYTSGSTGRPKGVEIPHAGLMNLVRWHQDLYRVIPEDRGTQVASPAFDASIWELWPYLAGGASVHIPDEETRLSSAGMMDWWSQEGITLAYLMTPLAEGVLEEEIPPHRDLEVRDLIIGGDRLHRGPDPGAGFRLMNHYGPAEYSVNSTVVRVPTVGEGRGLPTIGRPVDNTSIYLLDRDQQPVPVGVPGELYVTGVGLARGYLRRPELTAAKFVPDPWSGEPGARMYRTADLVRYLPDGDMDFLGRLDHQVKLRGFRIELGEIETALGQHPGVREAAVLVREDRPGDRRLVGYVTPAGEPGPAPEELREFLSERLPKYMVPAAWVVLAELPLTANGKVDRRALPAPDLGGKEREGFEEPQTATERLLAGIWSDLLDVEQVGLADNFFELGGDSILSIQMVARAARAGCRITARQVFEHPMLGELASAAGRVVESRVGQGPVTGPVPLTPIQRRYLEPDPVDSHHFNQAVLLSVRSGLSAAAVESAWTALLRHHDALRLRFERKADGWRQRNAGLADLAPGWTRLDLSAVPPGAVAAALAGAAARAQSSLDLACGPTARGVWFDLPGQEARLLLVVHHLAVDGVSWRVLLEDLATACGQLASDGEVSLPAKTTSYREWAERLAATAASWEPGAVAAERAWWSRECGSSAVALPVDLPGGENTEGQARCVSVALGAEETRALLQEVPAAYRTRIDDVLLTALARALAGAGQALRVNLEGHGREEILDGVDLSRTVGWFTILYPVHLDAGGSDLGGALRSVKEHLRAVPGRGMGWGLLRLLRPEGAAALAGGEPEISFNYMGQLDVALPEGSAFTAAPEPVGPQRSPRAERRHLVEVEARVVGGCLQADWSYGGRLHRRSTVESWAERFLSCLRELIAHCLSRVERRIGSYTPADFPLARLAEGELERLLGGEWGIESVYPLSPLQGGMYFETLLAPGSGVYVEQLLCRLEGELDEAALESACRWLLDRHGVLRTSFHGRSEGRPVQVVHGRAAAALDRQDWRELPKGERPGRLESLLAADRALGLDLSRAPLMRWTLVRAGEEEHWLLWTHHHILLDGWSFAALAGEFLEAYRALRLGEELRPARRRPYRDYIAWLESRDLAETERYWRRTVAGWSEPTPLPEGQGRGRGPAEASRAVPAALTGALQRQARRHQLTINTLVQGAWGLLLGRSAGVDDVVFGATVSGRPAELPGVEEIVGLFINTLPLRLRLSAGSQEPRLLPWLRELQHEQVELRQHEHSPLVEVHSWSEIPRGRALFETILVFESYPIDEAIRDAGGEGGMGIVEVRAIEQPHNPLGLAVTPGETLRLRLAYERARFDAATIGRMLGHLEILLGGMARFLEQGGEISLSGLPMLSEVERHQVLADWSGMTAEPGPGRCLHELVADEAARRPEAVAVACGEESLSYGELERRADRLARRLRGLGVVPEVKVGLMAEPSIGRVVGLLGVLKAGGAYVPLDPEHPPARLAWIVESSGMSMLLVEEALKAGLPAMAGSLPALSLVEGGPAPANMPALAPLVSPSNVAYAIYTSGSTGRPNGVLVPHRGAAELVTATRERFGIGPASRVPQMCAFTFDPSVLETFLALGSGATLVMAKREERLGEGMAELLGRQRITTMVITPPLLETLSPEGLALSSIVMGGDRCPAALSQRWSSLLALYNCYGPTETTICSAFGLCREEEEGEPAIGRPVGGTQVYLADRRSQPVPPGSAGELLVGGAGVARGYAGQADKTAERFVPHPWSAAAGERLYRTGDLARYRSDGRLEFLGRIDTQVKIRGVRIELGEIEAVLAGHEEVRQAAAVVRENLPGGRGVVAFVVPREGMPAATALRRHAVSRLPDAMVPARIVLLPSLPTTAHGKVDRKALAAWPLDGEEKKELTAPRTATEELLAGVFADLLGLERVGIEDDFFALGGHSLLATQMTSRIRAVLGVDLPLSQLFEAPTVAELARVVGKSRPTGEGRPIVPVPREGELPLSFAQQRLWFLDQYEPGNPAYNIPFAVRLEGAVSEGVLSRVFGEVVRRHEALRTTFRAHGGRPVQVIAPAPGPGLPLEMAAIDLSELPRPEREALALGLAREEARRPFDLGRGPLLRLALVRLAGREHLLLATMHHIVSDGWSVGVLVSEVAALYEAFSVGRPSPLPALPVQYADFALWQRDRLQGELLEGELAYWRRQLAGLPPALELPADRPRPAFRSLRGRSRPLDLPAGLVAPLAWMGRRQGATLFMMLLGSLAVLLGRLSGQEDIAVGSPIAARDRIETEGLIGFFVNTQVLRVDIAGDPEFHALLERVREVALGAYAHPNVPFERLVDELAPSRDPSHPPLFQVALGLQNAPLQPLRIPGLALSPLAVDTGTAKVDLLLSLAEVSGGLAGGWEASADLFDGATVQRLSGHLATLLSGIASGAGRRLSELPLLSAAEQHQLHAEWNDTRHPAPADLRLDELFTAAAERGPERIALHSGEMRVSYRELERRTGLLARRLRALGVGPEVRVGICAEEGIERIVAVVAVLQAGGAYVPFDPGHPTERLAWIRQDARIEVLLAQRHLADSVAGEGVAVLCLEDPPPPGPGSKVAGNSPAAGADNLAYVIYTSGSTGRPKGVMVCHRSVVHLLGRAIEQTGAGQHSRILQQFSFTFDPSVLETWLALAVGGCLCIVDRETRISGPALTASIRREGITTLPVAPPVLAAIPPDDLPSLRTVMSGGDRCPAELANRWASRGERFEIFNCYGPTETTIYTSYHRCLGSDHREPPIGRPLGNVAMRIADRRWNSVPVGVPGELWVSGAGVARGYLDRPALTAERFVPDPLSSQPGGRAYRSGDLARRRPDGEIEFLGRIDRQVKVRGLRIELGEIEAALVGHPAVRESVVEVREERAGKRLLVAYVVPRPGEVVEAGALRDLLAAKVPSYMVPAIFVPLPALPLLPTGKLDRQALPAPERSSPEEAVGLDSSHPIQALLAGIWAEVLGLEHVGAGDNFFALGGHSLLATQVVSRIRAVLEVELPLRRLFEAPTVAELARVVEESRAGRSRPAAPPKGAVPGEGEPPLSFAQQRLWFLDQLDPGNSVYNMPLVVRLRGALEPRWLEWSFADVVRRHEVLRTTFAARNGRPVQVVSPPAARPPCLPLADLAGLPPQRRDEEARALIRAEIVRPFALAVGPLLRVLLVRLAPGEHVLLVNLHHIVSDGWSINVLVGELVALYQAAAQGLPSPVPELPIQYAGFAAWQRRWLDGEVLERQRGYWRRQLAGAPAALDLPTDRPRPPVPRGRGGVRRLALGRDLGADLTALSRRAGATPFMTLLAAWAELLHRHAGQADVLVGTPIANRTRRELEGLIGFFVNTLVMRVDLGGDPAFEELLARVRETALGAYEHQDLPFELLVGQLAVERDLSRSPLFQVFLQLESAPAGAYSRPIAGDPEMPAGGQGAGGLLFESLAFDGSMAKFELSLTLSAVEGDLAGTLEYNRDLFDGATAQRWVEHLRTLLAGVAAFPGRALSEVSLLAEEERHQLLLAGNDTDAAFPAPAVAHGLFERQAEQIPEAAAVACGEEVLTYRELDRRANRLAHRLRRLGVGPEVLVALALERTPDLVAALLAVLKSGGAYIPLDPRQPCERLAMILADARPPVLVTQSSLDPHLPESPGRRVLLDAERGSLDGESAAAPESGVGGGNLAYAIFTSGSTGRPKGVEIPHRALANFLRSMARRPGLAPGDALLAVTPPAFDIAALELLLPLSVGGRVELASRDEAVDGALLAGRLAVSGAAAMQATPATWRMLLAASWPGDRRLTALCGGEALPAELAARLRPRVGALWNLYGPTETTIWSAARAVAEREAPVVFGGPLANTRLYLLDAHLAPVPPGAAGELAISGTGLARGYLGRPDLTAERFLPSPFAGEPEGGARLYRTGDLVRRRWDGELEFLGRIDAQVKIRGFRIELGEIESALVGHPGVLEAVVVASSDPASAEDRRLVAFYVAEAVGAREPSPEELRVHLLERLPAYMVPALLVPLAELPLTPNGKVDRKALPEPGRAGSAPVSEGPRTPLEETVADLWRQILKLDRVSVDDNFFSLGGHSLLAAQLAARLASAFQIELPLRDLFAAPTVAGLAAAVLAREPVAGRSEKIARALLRVKAMRAQSRPEIALANLEMVHS